MDTVSKDSKNFASGRGKDTLFRVTLQNQVDHIAIADSKSNMIINISTIIISLLIALLGSGLSFGGVNFLEKQTMIIPLIILMLSCLISTIYAVLAIRPKIGSHNDQKSPSSLMYFGVISSMNFDDYCANMMDLLQTKDSIYNHLTRDVFHQGRILKRKYRLVQYAFTIFITGLTISVILFLILWGTNSFA